MRYRSFISIVPAMLMAAVLAKPSTVLADEWHRTYNVSGKSTVHIETNDGAVRVSTWEGTQIEARVETASSLKRACPTFIGIPVSGTARFA